MLRDLTIAHSHSIDGFEMDFATSRRDPQECALVGSMIGLVSCHEVAVGGLPMDFGVEVGKCGAKYVVEFSRTVSVGGAARLGRMVDEVHSEELLEDFEVPAALHFHRIATNDGFRSLA